MLHRKAIALVWGKKLVVILFDAAELPSPLL